MSPRKHWLTQRGMTKLATVLQTVILWLNAFSRNICCWRSNWRYAILTRFSYYHTPPHNEVVGGILVSLRLSIRPSVRPASRVRSVASTVQDGFFPYLVQIINSMRGCVACDDPWPWPISSRSFGLDLKNRVRSVASTILDGFVLYLPQMIIIIRVCVACYVFFQNLEVWILDTFLKKFRPWPWKNFLQFSMDSFRIHHKWSLVWEGVLHIMTFDLDLYLQGHLALALKIVSAL